MPYNHQGTSARGDFSAAATFSFVDSGWSTPTTTSDCASGWGDDVWNLRLTQPRNLTVTVNDCCCPGDFYEIYVDDRLIGTTARPPGWGCGTGGSVSSGSVTISLCPGDHVIKVRDAGFDGHSFQEIQAQNMCPAGFTVSGSLTAVGPTPDTDSEEDRLRPTVHSTARAAELEELLREVEPFVYTDANGLERLRVSEAKKAGVRGDAIGLAMRVIALDNRVIAAAQRGEEVSLTPADVEFIEPLFLEIAQTDPCGTRQNPAPCPRRIESGMFFASREQAIAHLQSQGFHRTSNYAGGSRGNDFTKVVTHDCGGSTFREQAIVFERNGCWTYNLQGPEPNPEVLEYLWPRLGWAGYVRWWHQTFC